MSESDVRTLVLAVVATIAASGIIWLSRTLFRHFSIGGVVATYTSIRAESGLSHFILQAHKNSQHISSYMPVGHLGQLEIKNRTSIVKSNFKIVAIEGKKFIVFDDVNSYIVENDKPYLLKPALPGKSLVLNICSGWGDINDYCMLIDEDNSLKVRVIFSAISLSNLRRLYLDKIFWRVVFSLLWFSSILSLIEYYFRREN